MNDLRFRFRAWDYTHSKMVYGVYPYAIKAGDEEIFIPLTESATKDCEGHDILLTMQQNLSDCMQSTGLKDKNGKLIYGEDLVLDNEGNEMKIIWSQNEAAFIAMCWLGNDDWIRAGRLDAFYDCCKERMKVEIIGNSYEGRNLTQD